MNTVQHDKLLSSLRYWLIGKAENDHRYYMTLEALEYAKSIHVGKRKDGITEEFYHQLNIVSFLRNLVVYFEKPHILLAIGLLHDTIEDYSHTKNEIIQKFPEVYPYLQKINKMQNGIKLSNDEYYRQMTNCPITVVVKCVDRIHNLSTMDGVFTLEKMQSYIDEVRDYFLPMLKETRRNHPRYEAVFELLKTTLLLMVSNVESIISRGVKPTVNETFGIGHGLTLYNDFDDRSKDIFISQGDIKLQDNDCIVFSYNGKPGMIDKKSLLVNHVDLTSYYLQ